MNVILVEDDPTTLALLEKNLTKWGYRVSTAANGSEALEKIGLKSPDIIVSDWLMPEMNGLDLCRRVRGLRLSNYIYMILISAQDTRTDVVRGLESGVDDYLTKPLNLDELRVRLEIGCRIINLERELNQKYVAIKRNFFQTVHFFIQFLETYDRLLGSHCRRVGILALELAKQSPSVSAEDYPIIETAGFLHDIGFIGLPATLMSKPTIAYSGDEKKLYRSHPERGEEMLKQVDLLKPVARIVRMHHEQPDGLGFPDGLAKDQIPVESQLVSAASIYDDLVHRRGIPLSTIPEQLQIVRGYQIDQPLVDLLLEYHMRQMEAEASAQDRKISLDELKDSMVLSRDVLTKTGASVLPANTQVDNSAIDKLKNYLALGNISGKVFIYK